MNRTFLLVVVFAYIILTTLGSTYEHHTTSAEWAGNVEATGTISYLLDIKNAVTKLEVLGVETPIPIPDADYFSTLFGVMLWRFSFIVDDYEMVWMILLAPLAVIGVLSLALLGISVIRGNIAWS